ncbi:ComF family protein [Lentzea sp. JNUCC 0626]|uniref:ComF family protein n=1 Tax=Lentzea sp. JNUCC 0626 TaxID=3367513 RepID=UPI0037487F77
MSPLSRVLERYQNILIAPPGRGPNVCVTCFRATEHLRCLGEFDLVTVVPGTRQRKAAHPLIDILSRRLNITRQRFTETLGTSSTNTRQLRPNEYTVEADVAGKRVLLVDDQWTSGASLQSSAIALKRAGATRVVGLVIGRRLDAAPTGEFDWGACVLCQQG